MGRKKTSAQEPAATASTTVTATGGGQSKYSAVKRLVEGTPDISRGDIVARLKADGIDIDVSMASSYASKARSEIGGGQKNKGKRGRPRKAVTQSNGTSTGPATSTASRGNVTTEDVVALAGLVRKLGPQVVVQLAQAIG